MTASRSMKLSDSVVARLACPAGEKAITRSDITPNLSIIISPTSKLWRYRYRFGDKTVTLTLGSFPAMDYATAKNKAHDYERMRQAGKDPRDAILKPSKAATVADVLDYHLASFTNPETKRNATSSFKPVRAKFGKLGVGSLTRRALVSWIDEHYPEKAGAAAVMTRYLKSAFNRAMETEQSGLKFPADYANPCVKLKSYSKVLETRQPGSFARSFEDSEFSRMIGGLQLAYRDRTIYAPGVMILHLLLLTGARPGEIMDLKWSQVSRANGVTRIVKDKHKTWKKTGRARQILVFAEGEKVLEQAREFARKRGYKGEYVFPARRGQKNQKHEHVSTLTHYTGKVGKLAGVGFIPYNLRSGYINFALDRLGFEHIELIAENVGHTDVNTTLRYYRRHREDQQIDIGRQVDAAFAALPAPLLALPAPTRRKRKAA